jgi:transglutaminase-like putative cysteine protease
MNRRDFMRSTSAVFATLAFSNTQELFAKQLAAPAWRTFDVITRVEVLRPSGVTRVWLPAGLIEKTPFQKTLFNKFSTENGSGKMVENKTDALGMIVATFPAGVRPVMELKTRVATRDYTVDLSAPGHAPNYDRAELEHFLRPTQLLPTDGIVRETATGIVRGASTDVEQARALYEWIVNNTFRNPKTQGCGTGDIRWMLQSRDLSGKCADINSLYVGMARAVGLPARDVFGVRVGKSELGYKSLGASSEVVTKAQHCRAEVYLREYGWVPVDPADVRKVVLEEPPGNRPLDDDMVKKARTRLFGFWEMNWMAYNYAHDVALPGSSGAPVGFLMYPQAETAKGRLDSLDPEDFRYEITAQEVASATA